MTLELCCAERRAVSSQTSREEVAYTTRPATFRRRASCRLEMWARGFPGAVLAKSPGHLPNWRGRKAPDQSRTALQDTAGQRSDDPRSEPRRCGLAPEGQARGGVLSPCVSSVSCRRPLWARCAGVLVACLSRARLPACSLALCLRDGRWPCWLRGIAVGPLSFGRANLAPLPLLYKIL